MNVLSLFDGISCGRVALERAGIAVTRYYASEVDRYAQYVSHKNYPDIVQLGDVSKFDDGVWFGSRKVICINPKPDLIIGGSPCQGFSFAGKQLAFDDPRSALFWKYVEIVRYYKPKYFLLENVRMKKEHLQVITDALGVEPIVINSALVSAQNRVRYYWTNIPNITQPKDKGILLRDIIDRNACDKDKSLCIDAEYWKDGNLKEYFEKHRRHVLLQLQKENHRVAGVTIDDRGIRPFQDNIKKSGLSEYGRIAFEISKSDCLISSHSPKVLCDQNGYLDRKGHRQDNRVYSDLGKSPTLVTHSGGNKHVKVLHTAERGRRLTPDGTHRDDENGDIVRGYEVRPDEKSCALTTVLKDNYVTQDFVIRKLTPVECERLQTLPDDYTAGISNSQRYKALGNAWTVDVISHILSCI